jgi:CRP-like cAMP-binding protein/thioredoxin reductase/Pyruvate/2-oxoacid:ferredoxin oxidoreductase delta subunit
MVERVQIAIVGAGPGGLSAAAHAAELGIAHVLLEQGPAHANTIQRYQKGKHVMAEPAALPLRSAMPFEAGTREAVLACWADSLDQRGVDIRYGCEVTRIKGERPHFVIETRSGRTVEAAQVVLAIGVQGNPRLLNVPGDTLPCVQYTLDDPDAYRDEAIVVVGAGDAAIENALALTRRNQVYIVNRSDEFTRVKDGNLNAVTRAIDDGRLTCFYRAQCARIEAAGADAGRPWVLVLDTDQGEARIACDRIIARIGATPPRRMVEGCGIAFPTADPAALPVLSARYESSVPGLYVIGALAGYPLIKQAMNQGFEVVEYILGRDVAPADHPLLEARFARLPFGLGVNETLALMQERIPVFRNLNSLVFRELILGSDVRVPDRGEAIFRKNDYTNTFFTILAGSAEVSLGEESGRRYRLAAGEFFGEMGLLSGRRRSATVYAGPDCVLIESPRREIIRLIKSDESFRRVIDEHFIVRALQSSFAPEAGFQDLQDVARRATLRRFKADEALFREGDEADCLHLIRSGSVAVSRAIGGREVVTSYVAAGNYLGEMGLMGRTRRSATAKATVATETVTLDAASFERLLESNPQLRAQVQDVVRMRLAANAQMAAQPQAGDLISFFMQQGLGEATDVLLIDETLCVGCDNCEKACAETHGGTSRLDREAGPSFAQVHVPTSCRHCENPRCMTECPPDAIRRAANGEVFILDSCIGCGNCERNCPYGVIQMAAPAPGKPGLWSWLLFGMGPGPGEEHRERAAQDEDAPKKAVKCDMCKDLAGGPACVRACPTGAAIRISPDQFVELASGGGGS